MNCRKEERKYATNNEPVTIDVDALWAQMIAKPIPGTKVDEPNDAETNATSAEKKGDTVAQETGAADPEDPSAFTP